MHSIHVILMLHIIIRLKQDLVHYLLIYSSLLFLLQSSSEHWAELGGQWSIHTRENGDVCLQLHACQSLLLVTSLRTVLLEQSDGGATIE